MEISYSDIVIIALIAIFTIFGLIKGIFKKLMGFVVFGASIVLAYYVASPVSNALTDTEMYNSLVSSIGVEGAGWVFLCVIGLIAFVVFFIILKLLVHFLNKGIEKGTLLKAVNRLCGGAFGFLTGLLIGTIYLLVLHGLAGAIESVNVFYIQDLGFTPEHFTISKLLLNTTLELFKSGVPALV